MLANGGDPDSYDEEMEEEYDEELDEMASDGSDSAPMLVDADSDEDGSSEMVGKKKQGDSDSESSIEDDLDPEAAHSEE